MFNANKAFPLALVLLFRLSLATANDVQVGIFGCDCLMIDVYIAHIWGSNQNAHSQCPNHNDIACRTIPQACANREDCEWSSWLSKAAVALGKTERISRCPRSNASPLGCYCLQPTNIYIIYIYIGIPPTRYVAATTSPMESSAVLIVGYCFPIFLG